MKYIELTQGKRAIVDDEDYEELSKCKWYAYTDGYNWYAGHKVNKRIASMHRTVMKTSPDMETDHINGDGLDNRKSNLRVCKKSENKLNLKKYRTNTSGYKGVCWYPQTNKWKAQIQVNKKHIALGYFFSKEDAYKAYCDASKELHGEFSNCG